MFEPTLVGSWEPLQVKVTFADLASGTDTVTVWRQADSLEVVPGAERVFAAGGYTKDDLWAPHSIEVTYWAEMFDAAGASLGLTGRSSTIVWGPRNAAVFTDVYDPSNSVVVDMDVSFGGALQKQRPVERYTVGGRTVALMGDPGLFEGVDLSVKTDTREQADALFSVLSETLVLVRVSPLLRPEFPSLFYATVAFSVVDADHLGGFQFGGESAVWRITGDQVSPVTAGAAVSTITWQDLVDRFATWDDVVAAYPTWLDLLRNLGD